MKALAVGRRSAGPTLRLLRLRNSNLTLSNDVFSNNVAIGKSAMGLPVGLVCAMVPTFVLIRRRASSYFSADERLGIRSDSDEAQ